MKNQSRHKVLITRMLLVVLFLTSSGFTTVLRQCTMLNEASGQMDCCIPSRNVDGSQAKSTGFPGSTSIAQVDCHIATMIGGLPATSGIIEKNSNSILPKLAELAVVIDAGIVSSLNINKSGSAFSHFETNLSFSPDKRLLLSSLLI